MTWKEAVIYTLQQNKKNNEYLPMHFRDITDYIAENNLRQEMTNTPANTVSANLTTNKELFNQLGAGVYCLTEKGINYVINNTNNSKNKTNLDKEEESIEQQDAIYSQNKTLIQSYGMFWKRNAINWEQKPKLLGTQATNSPTIDLSEMRGVYMLYDGREVIYIGQAIDRPIIKRLSEHTKNRLATRWDRFSWFSIDSFDPKTEKVAKMPNDINTNIEILANALEGILIKGMEPRQNRRQGDAFGFEYYQVIDSHITKNKLIADFTKLLGKE